MTLGRAEMEMYIDCLVASDTIDHSIFLDWLWGLGVEGTVLQ